MDIDEMSIEQLIQAIFESGALNPDGSIQGNDNDADGTRFERHYAEITQPDQVQIYEELNTNAEGRFTTSFIRRDQMVKDNRLLPIGWTAHGPDPSLNGRYLASTHAEHVDGDADYEDGQGTDRITYRVTLPPGVDAARCTVQATLYYQAIPPSYLNDRFKAAPNGAATQRLYYLASHLKLEGTPAENWKLKIGSARAGTTRSRPGCCASPPT
jgi:hypothetical protein